MAVYFSERKGKWIADFYDETQNRHQPGFATKEKAEEYLETHNPALLVSGGQTLDVFATLWLERIEKRKGLAQGTQNSYKRIMRLHILPALGKVRLSRLSRAMVQDFLESKMTELNPATVGLVAAVLRVCLREAVNRGTISINPATGHGRTIDLHSPKNEDEVKAFEADELVAFLEAAKGEPEFYPAFLTMARTGIRLGEMLALDVEDAKLEDRKLVISKSWDYHASQMNPPKSRAGRREIDLSTQVIGVLREMLSARRAECFKRGRVMPKLLFCNPEGKRLHYNTVENAMKRFLKGAGLADHYSPHCLRHTFATLLLRNGENLDYVKKSLGHASISMTSDLYGRWQMVSNQSAVDKLDKLGISPKAQA